MTEPGFVGFEEPRVMEIDRASRWSDRVYILGEKHPGQWAKFGPYAEGTARNRASSLRSEYHSDGLLCDTAAEGDGDHWYVFVRVTKTNQEVSPERSRTPQVHLTAAQKRSPLR